jgi:hypothetical protein
MAVGKVARGKTNGDVNCNDVGIGRLKSAEGCGVLTVVAVVIKYLWMHELAVAPNENVRDVLGCENKAFWRELVFVNRKWGTTTALIVPRVCW